MQEFRPGDPVRIKSGPFASFISAVTEVETTRAVLIVEVQVFGRRTPVVCRKRTLRLLSVLGGSG
jgi:transcription antitermination factor NusG